MARLMGDVEPGDWALAQQRKADGAIERIVMN
jgi:hypothetical protein